MHHPAKFEDLRDCSVFITGGGSGIGAALVEGFLAQGARVAFADIADARDLTARLGETYGAAPLFIQTDITDTPALHRAVAQSSAAHGAVAVLVNNAANDQRHTLAEMTPEFWDKMQAINLKAYYFACQAVAPGMIAAGGGAIINFSSTSYIDGQGGMTAYTTANGAITAMTRSLARELGASGIRVNAIAPGWVLTDKQMAKWATPNDLAAHLARQRLPEHIYPADLVPPVLFLASAASRMITGQLLPVDGGFVVTG